MPIKSVWSRYNKGDADTIEKVQKRATKLVISLKNYHIGYRSSSSFEFSHTQVQKTTW